MIWTGSGSIWFPHRLFPGGLAAIGGCGLPGEEISLIAASKLKPAGREESPGEGKGGDHESRLGRLRGHVRIEQLGGAGRWVARSAPW